MALRRDIFCHQAVLSVWEAACSQFNTKQIFFPGNQVANNVHTCYHEACLNFIPSCPRMRAPTAKVLTDRAYQRQGHCTEISTACMSTTPMACPSENTADFLFDLNFILMPDETNSTRKNIYLLRGIFFWHTQELKLTVCVEKRIVFYCTRMNNISSETLVVYTRGESDKGKEKKRQARVCFLFWKVADCWGLLFFRVRLFVFAVSFDDVWRLCEPQTRVVFSCRTLTFALKLTTYACLKTVSLSSYPIS